MDRDIRKKRLRFHLKVKNKNSFPRVSFFRSNRRLYAQIINDNESHTFLSIDDRGLKGSKSEKAIIMGKLLADKYFKAGFKEAVYDRSWYRFHGVVKNFFTSFQDNLK